MNALEAALVDIATFLEESAIPYMVIGGYANLRWGRPRLTEDIDITVSVAEPSWPEFVAAVEKRYCPLAPNPLEFARQTRVIPISTSGGVRVDLVLSALGYEETAIRRAVRTDLGSAEVRICTAEDLIVHKLIAARPRDLDDIEGIVIRRGAQLDRLYLDPLVEQIASTPEGTEATEFFRRCLEKAGLPPPRAER